jgi:hypothetical protein
MAGAVAKLPPIAVKLNGVIAYTNPSSGRYSTRFHTPGELTGCSAQQLTRESRVEPPEVDELARGVDLRLIHRFRLAEHGGGHESRPPRTGEEISGLEENRGALVERQVLPLLGGPGRGGDGRLRVLGRRVPDGPERVAVAVGRDHVDGSARAHDPFPSDDMRQIHRPRAQLDKARLHLGTFRGAWRVVAHRLVRWMRQCRDGVHSCLPSIEASAFPLA